MSPSPSTPPSHHPVRRPLRLRRRYPWPASQIDRDVMHELHLLSEQTGQSITALIATAVHEAMTRRLEHPSSASAPSAPSAPVPASAIGFALTGSAAGVPAA